METACLETLTATQGDVTPASILSAVGRIGPFLTRTPLVRNSSLSESFRSNIYLKLELFQKTGAFKVRGAFNKLLSLMETEKPRGVLAVSGGNHGQAVAYAARKLGLQALILMPEITPQNYVRATQSYGAEVIITRTMADAFGQVRGYQERGWSFIHPFDDPLVIAGQGTLGLEILEDAPQVTDVIVSIGGGGLAGGVGVAIRAERPDVRIWGVETLGADSMARAWQAGKVVELSAITSIAHTLGAPAVSARTLALAQEHLESVTVVSDAEAFSALRCLLERAKVLAEPASSCTLAAAHRLRAHFTPEHHVVLILCGGNVALSDLLDYQQKFPDC
jgi:threonine dehydratase